MSLNMTAARSPPRSEPANGHDLRSWIEAATLIWKGVSSPWPEVADRHAEKVGGLAFVITSASRVGAKQSGRRQA